MALLLVDVGVLSHGGIPKPPWVYEHDLGDPRGNPSPATGDLGFAAASRGLRPQWWI